MYSLQCHDYANATPPARAMPPPPPDAIPPALPQQRCRQRQRFVLLMRCDTTPEGYHACSVASTSTAEGAQAGCAVHLFAGHVPDPASGPQHNPAPARTAWHRRKQATPDPRERGSEWSRTWLFSLSESPFPSSASGPCSAGLGDVPCRPPRSLPGSRHVPPLATAHAGVPLPLRFLGSAGFASARTVDISACLPQEAGVAGTLQAHCRHIAGTFGHPAAI